jgi:hypothetical protein
MRKRIRLLSAGSLLGLLRRRGERCTKRDRLGDGFTGCEGPARLPCRNKRRLVQRLANRVEERLIVLALLERYRLVDDLTDRLSGSQLASRHGRLPGDGREACHSLQPVGNPGEVAQVMERHQRVPKQRRGWAELATLPTDTAQVQEGNGDILTILHSPKQGQRLGVTRVGAGEILLVERHCSQHVETDANPDRVAQRPLEREPLVDKGHPSLSIPAGVRHVTEDVEDGANLSSIVPFAGQCLLKHCRRPLGLAAELQNYPRM